MSTITIDNPNISNQYTDKELQMKFLRFLEMELQEESVSLYEIEVQNMSSKSQERYKNRNTLQYVDY